MLRDPHLVSRRLVAVAAMLGVATGCTPTGTEPSSEHGAHTVHQVSAASANLGPEVAKGLASLRRATAAFHDVQAAIAAGYADPAGIPCVASPAGTMGIHAAKGSAVDGVVDPNAPEVLLYLPREGGGFKLVGVEYLVPALVRNNETNEVSIWLPDTHWGPGYTLLTPTPTVFGEAFEGPMPGHEPGMPWHYDKHIWVWETNPAGIFSQWNPSISCP